MLKLNTVATSMETNSVNCTKNSRTLAFSESHPPPLQLWFFYFNNSTLNGTQMGGPLTARLFLSPLTILEYFVSINLHHRHTHKTCQKIMDWRVFIKGIIKTLFLDRALYIVDSCQRDLYYKLPSVGCSVTRWLDCFPLFGHLQRWKFGQKHNFWPK